jgi:hypothetical protein
MPAGAHTYVIHGRRNAVVTGAAGAKISTAAFRMTAIAPEPAGAIGYRFPPARFRHYTIFNENFDPAWAGYVRENGRWKPLGNFMADGFANAWDVPAGTPLVIVNTLQIVSWISIIFALLLFATYAYTLNRALRART